MTGINFLLGWLIGLPIGLALALACCYAGVAIWTWVAEAFVWDEDGEE